MARHWTKRPVQVFDPKQEFKIAERRLPHWSQAGTISFITWRTWDSMPEHVVRQWLAEREEWLRRHDIDPSKGDWEKLLAALPQAIQGELREYVAERWNNHLDGLYGACVLRRPELAEIVACSLRHFDGERYVLTDFAIVANHVHVLAAFPDEEAMLGQCESWKHYTATRINHALGRKGRFWEQDAFDHLVRSEGQFAYLRRYIADNPDRARLKCGEFVVYSSRSAGGESL